MTSLYTSSYLPVIRASIVTMYDNYEKDLYVFYLRVKCKDGRQVRISIDGNTSLEFCMRYTGIDDVYHYFDRHQDLNAVINDYFEDLEIVSVEML